MRLLASSVCSSSPQFPSPRLDFVSSLTHPSDISPPWASRRNPRGHFSSSFSSLFSRIWPLLEFNPTKMGLFPPSYLKKVSSSWRISSLNRWFDHWLPSAYRILISQWSFLFLGEFLCRSLILPYTTSMSLLQPFIPGILVLWSLLPELVLAWAWNGATYTALGFLSLLRSLMKVAPLFR